MYAGLLFLYMIAAASLAVSLILLVIAALFLHKGRRYAKMQKELLVAVEERTKKEYNRIALMSPGELGVFLSKAFSQCIELQSDARISEKDPEAIQKLYAHSYARLYEYLGRETVEAIDYYYGSNYVMRWAELSFAILTNRGMVTTVVKNNGHPARYEMLMKGLTTA